MKNGRPVTPGAWPITGNTLKHKTPLMRLRTSRPVVWIVHGTALGWPLRWLWAIARSDDTRARLGILDEWSEEISVSSVARVIRRLDDFEAVELRVLAAEEALFAVTQRSDALEAALRALRDERDPDRAGSSISSAEGAAAPGASEGPVLLDVPPTWASEVEAATDVAVPPPDAVIHDTGAVAPHRGWNPNLERDRPAPQTTRCDAYAQYIAKIGDPAAAFVDLGSTTEDLRLALASRGVRVNTPDNTVHLTDTGPRTPRGISSESEALDYLRSLSGPASGVLLSQFGGYLTSSNLPLFLAAADARLAPGGVVIVETANLRCAQAFDHSPRRVMPNAPISEDLLARCMQEQGFRQLRRLFSAPVCSRASVDEDPASWYLNMALLGWKP
jgi:hypothetical protein